MTTKTDRGTVSPLVAALPEARFTEYHCGVVEAPREQVWAALHQLRWRDLRVAVPLMTVRGLAVPVLADRVLDMFTRRAGAVLAEDPPASSMLLMVGRPWSLVPRRSGVGSMAQALAFDQPGWLRYGLDFVLHPLPGGRTLVETHTRCQGTDATAERRFSAYWAVIRPFSGLIRSDILAALQRAVAER